MFCIIIIIVYSYRLFLMQSWPELRYCWLHYQVHNIKFKHLLSCLISMYISIYYYLNYYISYLLTEFGRENSISLSNLSSDQVLKELENLVLAGEQTWNWSWVIQRTCKVLVYCKLLFGLLLCLRFHSQTHTVTITVS